MKVNTKKLAVPLAAVIAFAGGAAATVAAAADAQTPNTTQTATGQGHGPMGVVGTVTAVNGSTITLTGKDGKTYTVNATSAAIDKVSTITTAQIAAGDTLMVGGQVSGTSVTADHIMDGTLPAGGLGDGHGPMGFGKPGVFGTVSAVSGNTLTVAGRNGTTYTVDASSAKVMKAASGAKPATAAVSDIAVGDSVMIGGTVSGTSVTATDIMDGIPQFHGSRDDEQGTTTTDN